MSLGVALVHPTQVEMALSGDPLRLGMDDGVDMILSAIGAGGLEAEVQAECEAVFETQFAEIGAQFTALLQAGGPLAGLMDLGSVLEGEMDGAADIDLVALLEKFAEFLCELEPAVVQGLLSGFLNPVVDALPIFDAAEIAARAQAIANCVVDALEAPMLSGRDDIAAHRSYRSATMMRIKVCPLFEGLEDFVARADLAGAIQAAIEFIPDFEQVAVDAVRQIGCFLRDTILPVVRCARGFSVDLDVDVDVGGGSDDGDGPVGMSDTHAAKRRNLLDFDTRPAPFDVGSAPWVLDLVGNVGALSATVFNDVRTRNPPGERVMAFLFGDLLIPAWMLFRGTSRAFGWDFLDGPGPSGGTNTEEFDPPLDQQFVRALFSDWGDFSVQAVLHTLASLSDSFSWANWISALGLRFIRYLFFALQPRIPYLWWRAVDYMVRWNGLDSEVQDDSIRLPRITWLHWGPVALVSLVVGISFGYGLWERFSIQDGGMLGAIIGISAGVGLASFFATPSIVSGAIGDSIFLTNELRPERWHTFFVMVAFLFVLLIAVLTLFQTENRIESADGPGEITGWVLGFVGIAAFLLISSMYEVGFTVGVFQVIAALGAVMVPGVMMLIAWYYAVADGRDAEDVFEGRDPSTSPYLLPYPQGEIWLCGQGFHGFFSHLYDKDTNHYSYDFNEDFGSKALAVRSGLVTDVRDAMTNKNTRDNNTIEIQHLDWVDGHDPGWDLERTLTYAGYTHLAERRAFVNLGQLVRQGYNVAEIDDTGVSAMDHLHFNIESGQSGSIINMPAVFRDESLRRTVELGWIDGKPGSLTFARSDNVEDTTVVPVEMDLTLTDAPLHEHTLTFPLSALADDGTIPDPVTLTTGVADAVGMAAAPTAHVHQISLTRAEVLQLLQRRDVTGVATTTVDGHTHDLAPLPTMPSDGASREVGGNQPASTNRNAMTLRSAAMTITPPPDARLLAHRPGPHQLLGQQMFIRVNGAATEWFTFGAHRPGVDGDLVLDRAPGMGSGLRVAVGGNTTQALPADVMAATGARLLTAQIQNAGVDAIVRVQPSLVIETRRRGTSTSVEVTASPPAMQLLTPGPQAGTGTVARLDGLTRQTLVDLISEAITQRAGVPTVAAILVGNGVDIRLDGLALTGFTGSTPRVERVLTAWYTGTAVDEVDPLPLTSGVLRLDNGTSQLDVAIVGAPARIVIPGAELGAARLDVASAAEEPLILDVSGDPQTLRFDEADDGPAAVAQRILSQAEGVRAWDRGGDLVIETVAVGNRARLGLAKGTAVFPAATAGSAPTLGGADDLADSTAVSLATLRELVTNARAELVRPTAPATVTVTADGISIEADAGDTTPIVVEGPDDLMAALDATPRVEGTGSVVFTGLADPIDLPSGGWLDITIDADTWRVDLAGEPARADVALDALPAAGDVLTLDVDGSAVDITFVDADVTSLHSLFDRIRTATGDAVTVRLASRYAVEGSRHGQGDLEVGAAAGSPATAGAGFLAATIAETARGSYDDVTTIDTVIDSQTQVDGDTITAFTAADNSGVLEVTATGGGPVTITPDDTDPFGLATGSMAAASAAMGRQSVGYVVEAAETTTTVEFNAAPAHLHTEAGLAAVGVPGDAADLIVTTTSPGGVETTATVDLGGVADLDEVARRIQREAPHVRAWTRDGTRLDVDTPGGGTGWGLRLDGAAALVALGFRPEDLDGDSLSAEGSGNVADGDDVGQDEVGEILRTVGTLATFDPAELFVASDVGGALVVDSRAGVPDLTSQPAGLAGALGSTVAGETLTSAPGPFRLDTGWLTLRVGDAIAAVAPVWGRRAWLEADDPVPADPTADLAALDGQPVSVTVDSVTMTTVVPTGLTTVAELLSHLNRDLGGATQVWFGLVDRGGATHVRVESRRRGRSSGVRLILPLPALGFPTSITAETVEGDGSVDDLANVTATDLALLLTGGRGRVDTPQGLIDATTTATDLRLTATGGRTVTLTAATQPHGLVLAPVAAPARVDMLTVAFNGPLETGTSLSEIQVLDLRGPNFNRTVQVLLDADSARIGPMSLPATLSALDGLTLDVTADGTAFVVTFASITAELDVIDQIEREGEGRVRASIDAGQLSLETIRQGTAARLDVDAAASTAISTAVVGGPPAVSATGSGNVQDARSVTSADYVDVIDNGFAGPPQPPGGTDPNRTVDDIVTIRGRPHARLQSGRSGCRSSLELLPRDPTVLGTDFAEALAAGPPPLDFDRSLGFGPAVRASVALAPFVGRQALNGALWITLNENATPTDLAPTSEIEVTFAGDYDAREAADEIDAALSEQGIGSAVAFPDGVIVIETHVPGLAGTVTVPSTVNVSDPGVLAALGLGGPPLTQRGWPGAGSQAATSGWRSTVDGPSRVTTTWNFNGIATTLLIRVGDTVAQVATALDAQLIDASNRRIGIAVVGDDGALHLEIFQPNVTFDVGADAVRPDQPRSVERWIGGDTPLEPAFEMRSTTTLRTFRMVYFEQVADGIDLDSAVFDPASERIHDVGWVRPPTNADGDVQRVPRWAPGRWLLASRPDAARSDTLAGTARTRGYSGDADMIVSGGTADISGVTVDFAHRARYWVAHSPSGASTATTLSSVESTSLRVVRFGEEFLVDHLVLFN